MRDYDPFEMAKWETNEMSKTSVHSLIKALCPLDFEQDEATNVAVQQERFRVIVEVREMRNDRYIDRLWLQNLSFKLYLKGAYLGQQKRPESLEWQRRELKSEKSSRATRLIQREHSMRSHARHVVTFASIKTTTKWS
jgi:hypothetical protein